MSQIVSELSMQLKRLIPQARAKYSLEVDVTIHEQCSDPKRIEQLLDNMLDFCFDPEILCLYKDLCRYYFAIDPEATVQYVNFYRELWDEEGNAI